MKISWGWLLLCSRANLSEGSVEIDQATATSTVPVLLEASCADYVAFIPPRSDPAVVLQVLSKEYLEIEQNFVYHMELNSLFTRDSLYLICLDTTSSRSIESTLGIRCVNLEEPQDGWTRAHVWNVRAKVNRCLLMAGYNVLLSDADAVWLEDPMKDMDLLGVSKSNIVAQRDLRPRYVAEIWGVTLCFGFIFFRAGGTLLPRLLETVASIARKIKDDQKALNLALFSLGIVWDEDGDMTCQTSTRVGRGVIRDGDESFVVSLLPHSSYPRWCERAPISPNRTVVAHCLSKRKGPEMSIWMKSAGVWHVSENPA